MARLNLEQLKAFLAVIRLGGINKASTALNLTQPAVSSRIRNLEETLGAQLFERSATGIRLTKRGELLVRYAEQIERTASRIEKDVMDPKGVEGLLRIGVSETIAQCWLPDFISRLHQRFPNLEIEINVDISVNLREDLLNREIDLAILLGPISEYSVDNIMLPVFDLAWYVSSGTDQPEDGPSGHLRNPIITYARNTRPYRELKAELFDRIGPSAKFLPSSSLSACFRLVEAGLGVAALPRVLGNEFVDVGRLLEFDPGWVPSPLRFSVSYLGDPPSDLVATAALLAEQTAKEFLEI
ncbi:MAG: LysR family transcriptional regulator [Candidatus Competibacteraceae bacterium]|jgi:DNA-binding transcriptional LysR family regulator|nr:LysR family transcriptional regulator [Candidatus Competibacteraceae bacterium]